ncbi:MAG: hypothetical protein H8E34_10410 [Bacteroidetes bacterium]|nr:hypothetical protein [Bacteroidota bacterium]
MEKYKRNSVFDLLKEYCYLSKEHDFIEVTEWHNGDGFDVDIGGDTLSLRFQLTWGQFKALKKLAKKFDKK